MYAQFFGNYLLSKRAVTSEQVIQAMEEQHIRHLKLGTLAIHAGYMDAAQVDDVLMRQAQECKRFGELAVEAGYLTNEQVEDLLSQQIPIYLLIGQQLVENGALTNAQLEELITSYQRDNQLSHLDNASMHQENLDSLIFNLFLITFETVPDYLVKYLSMLFNSLIRFIGEDYTPLNPTLCNEYVTTHCSGQTIDGEFSMISYLDMDEDAAIAFASRYIGETFTEYNEYVHSAIDDFLNIHNGLFNVNISNDISVELLLSPPMDLENTMISSTSDMFHLPIIYPFGTLNLLIKL